MNRVIGCFRGGPFEFGNKANFTIRARAVYIVTKYAGQITIHELARQ